MYRYKAYGYGRYPFPLFAVAKLSFFYWELDFKESRKREDARNPLAALADSSRSPFFRHPLRSAGIHGIRPFTLPSEGMT